MTRYSGGADFEREVIHHLRAEGYETVRSAGSKGKADVLAWKAGEFLVIQAKRGGTCPPAERREVIRLASLIADGIPLVASRPGVTFRRLTGPGPRDWEPWATDRLGAA
ncbi:restriction endonuclease [Cellulomonas shaoxiangyii]|uniref:Holliday junction resolvase n=1 Tax=Cellulomonas shaoxiangyii TaxID=2566013 RepID=A0A4P7SI77_9CELL|nr:restriction endonuclease [Cellulomonas shaoxiangyii]QCB93318.1 Holliday junction resolvase [Cellulomonas shaoxiangyii]TGY79423.1 Holliday junction resolvase [Cellulomonas shaoxiangyii]